MLGYDNLPSHSNISFQRKTSGKLVGRTHTGELDAAVTAFWRSTLLLDVQVSEVTAGGLDDADLVGPGVVTDHGKEKMLISRSTRNFQL